MTRKITAPRLYVDAPLRQNQTVAVAPKQAHYLRHVMRLRDGAELLVFNGRDGEWQARLQTGDKKSLYLVAREKTRPQAAADGKIWVLAALIKRDRLDYMAQKATEMGVGRLLPIITQNTQNRRININRLRANAIEAAEQCGILTLPEIAEAEPLAHLLADWAEKTDKRQIIFCDETAAPTEGQAALKKLTGQKLAVLVGPEGGFGRHEIATLRARDDCHSISLGPRLLRADTAMVAALALVQSTLGDWRTTE